jgi:hypothetical protein
VATAAPTAKKKAIVVVAHAVIVIIWHVLAIGTPYHELGADCFTTRQDPEKQAQRLIAKLEALGHKVTVQPAAAACPVLGRLQPKITGQSSLPPAWLRSIHVSASPRRYMHQTSTKHRQPRHKRILHANSI